MATPSAILQQTAHTTYILGWSSLSLALHMVSQTDVSHSALCVIVNQKSIKKNPTSPSPHEFGLE